MRYIIDVFILLVVAGGAVLGFIYYPKLIPKRKKGQKQGKSKTLFGDKDQLATIFSSIEDGLVLVDDKGAIGLLNLATAMMIGWNVEDAIGLNVETVIRVADDQGNLLSGNNYPFKKVLSSGQSLRDNTSELLNRDNKKVSIGLTITPLKDSTGKVTGAVALIRNIAEEKQQEGRLADFISTASHEMRTPVAAIEGYLALALNNKVANVDNKAREYLIKAQTATKHLGTLFQDLLTSAKAEDGRLVSHPEVVELGELLRGITEDLKFVAEKHGLSTEFILGSSSFIKATGSNNGIRNISPLYYTYVDQDRLREVINNLYDNAVKYTQQGKISIGLTGDNEVVQFYIRDTGTGIPSEDIPHLFQKFYRVDNSATRTTGGNGLGLFISRKIIELYSGRIWVESEVGKGSTFYINLPRLSSQKATEMMENKDNSNTIAPPTANTMAMT